MVKPNDIYIGGKGGNTQDHQFFTGLITAVETYRSSNPPTGILFPEALKQLIISNQLIKSRNACVYKN